ncbi:hypothetical protein [Tardiphaga sp. 841_E9_N1_2]|jgi:hypothetical protein|uniref:hypothetical protein n=1 Tax=Tardiphaga sp. 841_E9_N1_2 TaxID=3240762 RepID=UPI003F273CF2
MSDPWIAYAQTKLAANSVKLNPDTHSTGLVGEVTLPYTVPAGKVLRLKRLGIEPLWGAAMIPYIGDSTSTTEAVPTTICLKTYSSGGTRSTTLSVENLLPSINWDCDYFIPAGKKLNLRLAAGANPGPGDAWIYGWAMSGELLDA